MTAPEFSKYSLEQLKDAHANINRNLYPENYNLLVEELKKRGISEEDMNNPRVMEPEGLLQENIRSYGKVLLFGIITLGIYWLYWYYANLKELDRHFVCEKDEKDIKLALNAFVIYIILHIVAMFVAIAVVIARIETIADAPAYPTPGLESMLVSFFSLLVESVFIFMFLNAVKLGQEKAKIEGFTLFPMFALYLGGVICQFIYSAFMLPLISILSAVLLILFYYKLQDGINSIWKAEIEGEAEHYIVS